MIRRHKWRTGRKEISRRGPIGAALLLGILSGTGHIIRCVLQKPKGHFHCQSDVLSRAVSSVDHKDGNISKCWADAIIPTSDRSRHSWLNEAFSALLLLCRLEPASQPQRPFRALPPP